MKYLLDAQALLWFINGDKRLPGKYRDIFAKSSNQIFISLVTIWEIGIKNAIGKLSIKGNLQEFVKKEIEGYNFYYMDIRLNHIIEATSLPMHHRDPFDRLLIAQSRLENIPVISSDLSFDKYGITRIW